MIRPVISLLVFFAAAQLGRADVLINEIMYHPQSENPAEEYVELYNSDSNEVDLSNWKLTGGVEFTFPAGAKIAARGYLVVASNAPGFATKYPTVTNVVAGWTGRLSNASNTITLRDVLGAIRNDVTYSDDGEWGQRVCQDSPDYGHRGWVWKSDADGFGKSLELINVGFDNSRGQNWAPSTSPRGTPGAPNSVSAANVAPVISDVSHFPVVPKSADPVTITCRVVDDHAALGAVTLNYRVDGSASFTTTPIFDDGAHGDALAGDGIFGAIVPPQPNGTIVEFYFVASDAASFVRTWPAPARDYTGDYVQNCNCLYQVDDSTPAGSMPTYRLIMRATDRTELSNINSNTATPPFPYNPGETTDQTQSHARFNATFISHDGTGTKVRYLAGVRNRGNGSRSLQPQSFNVQFPNDRGWNGRVSINLNSQNTPWQLLGSALYRKAGLSMSESRAIQLRINGANPAGTNAPAYGFYVCNEFQNSDFAEHHFPLDSSGNIYRAQRLLNGTTAGGTDLNGADLGKIVPAPTETLSLKELFKLNYRKETNSSEDNWSDLIGLTEALAKAQSGATPGATIAYAPDYVASVESAIDVQQWMRWFAVNAFADNEETNLSNGDGDDYSLYFGATDTRAKLLPYDLDTILGRSSGSNSATHGIFRMVDAPNSAPTPINPLIKHPRFAPLYYGELKRLLDGAFNPAQFDPLVDEVLTGTAPANVLTTIKSFNAARHAHISTLVPQAISVTASQDTGGTDLTVQNGFPRITSATCNLIGVANAVSTRTIKVNGLTAAWSAWEAKWTANNVALTPGVNRILIQAFDENGTELQRAYHDVWFDDGTEATYTGTLAASERWTAAGGPYRITGSFTIPSGVVLTVDPGAVVLLGSSTGTVNFTVASGGKLIAEGTEEQPIRFTRPPGATYTWGGITINGAAGTPESRIAHAYIEGNSTTAIDVNAADVVLDHLQFGTTTKQYLSLDGASFLVSNCLFPSATGSFELTHGTQGIKAGGRGIVRDCFFGRAQGYNDVFDFTGGNRPGPILQVINCVFIGSDDDLLDLDGTDAWIEGNIFMHVHRNGAPDSSSAVSGGNDSGQVSDITVVGNLFYDMDQAATAKQGNFYTLLNNTVVDQNGRGSQDTVTALVNFADEGTTEAAGMYLEGNVVHSAIALVRNYNPAVSAVTFNNNVLPTPWTGLGAGNVVASAGLRDPLNIPTPTEENFRQLVPQIRNQFGLLGNSPGKGTGPNGTDMGGVRPFGVSLSGAPSGVTKEAAATLQVGTLMSGSGVPTSANTFPQGSGWTHYRWRVNGGQWSSETATSTPISLTNLANGQYVVEVAGKNDAGFYQDDPVFGDNARTAVASWTVDTAHIPPPATALVQINEVLAVNATIQSFGTVLPDIIELRNAGTAVADLSGWGLTDNSAQPYKYKIPDGTTLAPGAYLVIYASGNSSVPQPRTGFGLKANGDTLTLTRSAAVGGGVADSVPFGSQLPDYSIGRSGDGSWALCRPTFGAPNILAESGSVRALRINEWLAQAEVLAGQDFIELTNTSSLPVDLGLCYLTDNPSDWPQRSQVRQLTFIAPGGYLAFNADNDPSQGPNHLNFKLEVLQGEIGLFDRSLALLGSVVYGPQSPDVSQGRTPNGTGPFVFFTQPTPGGPNPGFVGTTSTSTVNLLGAVHRWKYFADGASAPAADSNGRSFVETEYNDATWSPSATDAAQLFYIETASLTNTEGFQKTTTLPGIVAARPYQTYYFRTHFNYSGPLTDVTLTAKVMVDDGAVIYLNGTEVRRIRIGSGTPTYSTLANGTANDAVVETFTLPSASLVQGDNVLAVEVHQVNNQSGSSPSSDVVWGMKLDASYTVVSGTIPVVLSEVLTIDSTHPVSGSRYAGWIELHNSGDTAWNIEGMSLSDDVTQPRKFVFAPGTSIPAGASLTLDCNPLEPISATNTGFNLNGGGGVVALYHTLANGGGLHDSVAYGRQIPDYSIGRTIGGLSPWTLCVPTPGALNSPAALGSLNDVKINEWLAVPASGSGFVELFNTGTLPVALGGSYLTDDLTNRTKKLIPALSFIGGSGSARWQRWIADNDNGSTPEHVNFSVSAAGEGLGLFSAAGVALDSVGFGLQKAGVSGGRYPDGGTVSAILMPTPAAPNQLPVDLDTDTDGLPDWWETANGFNLNDPADGSPSADQDYDGQSNRSEYLAGTDPRNAADLLSARLARSAGVAEIHFRAIAGKTYTVQFKTSLTDPSWQKLTDVPAGASTSEVSVEDVASGSLTQRFYRVVTPAVP
ncbi:lamin tail domain-containing protein [Verrucomicrobiota bacterium sgz303538]